MGWLISVIETQDDQVGFVPGHEDVLRGLGWIRRGEATTITILDRCRTDNKDAA